MGESRTENTIRNVKTGMIVQLINKIMAFVVRTVFIKVLNSEYLGLNGLFTNILTIIAFAELGIGTAMTFHMYNPVANQDKEKIKSLVKFYEKSYNVIGTAIILIGILAIPFINIIVKEATKVKESIILIYLLFLIDTAISYFFAHKKSIIIAHQKQSVIDSMDSIFYLVKRILDTVFLILTKNYIVYLILQILGTFIENIITVIKANKMYPYLSEKDVQELTKKEKKDIISNVKAFVLYKLGGVIITSTDNILMSALLNVSLVGMSSNYLLIMNSVKLIISSALNGVTASVGNLNVVEKQDKKEKIFHQITFANYIVYSFCSIAFMILINPFIQLWIGQEYVLSIAVSVVLAINFFMEGLRNASYTYRTTLGLFEKARFMPYVGVVINIILSVILCKFFGVTGIFIATVIAQFISYSVIDPYIVYKYEFKTSVKNYFKKCMIYILVFTVITIGCLMLSNIVTAQGVLGFIIKIIIVCIIPNIINLIVFRKTEEFIQLKEKILKPIITKFKKI